VPGSSVLVQAMATSVSWLTNSPGPTSSPIQDFTTEQKNLKICGKIFLNQQIHHLPKKGSLWFLSVKPFSL